MYSPALPASSKEFVPLIFLISSNQILQKIETRSSGAIITSLMDVENMMVKVYRIPLS